MSERLSATGNSLTESAERSTKTPTDSTCSSYGSLDGDRSWSMDVWLRTLRSTARALRRTERCSLVGKGRGTRTFWNATYLNPRPETFNGRLAILVDGCSMSTSEILAGGLRDLERARIFGTRIPGAARPFADRALAQRRRFPICLR